MARTSGVRARRTEKSVVHVSTRLDDGTWVIELRTAPDATRPVLDAEPGETVELELEVALEIGPRVVCCPPLGEEDA